jgi:hypothetical protein
MKRFLLALLTLVFTFSAQAITHDLRVIQFENCSAQLLQIRLNYQNKSSKADLVRATQILADYPQLVFTPVKGKKHESVYDMSLRSYDCGAADCSRLAGWTEVQYRLLNLKGVKLSCSDDAVTGGAQQEQKQEQKEDSGGVTGGN